MIINFFLFIYSVVDSYFDNNLVSKIFKILIAVLTGVQLLIYIYKLIRCPQAFKYVLIIGFLNYFNFSFKKTMQRYINSKEYLIKCFSGNLSIFEKYMATCMNEDPLEIFYIDGYDFNEIFKYIWTNPSIERDDNKNLILSLYQEDYDLINEYEDENIKCLISSFEYFWENKDNFKNIIFDKNNKKCELEIFNNKMDINVKLFFNSDGENKCFRYFNVILYEKEYFLDINNLDDGYHLYHIDRFNIIYWKRNGLYNLFCTSKSLNCEYINIINSDNIFNQIKSSIPFPFVKTVLHKMNDYDIFNYLYDRDLLSKKMIVTNKQFLKSIKSELPNPKLKTNIKGFYNVL